MALQCSLCPKGCILNPGESGNCRIRINLDDRLLAVTYAHPCSIHIDPVEKKPLFHFLPGTPILSIATVGCNLHCKNCQNWEISQRNPEDSTSYRIPPADLVELARRQRTPSIAYTYTEPVAYYEYTLDTCMRAREAGLLNVLVTAAYINRKPWRELCRYVDAANIDLKAFSDRFYREICDGTLQPVLDALVTAREMGVLVEVTNLVIPTLNDSDEDFRNLCRWVVREMGRDTPLHFSRFFPHYRMRHLPPTPLETLERARSIALSEGLYFVYIGNVLTRDAENTICPGCGRVLVRRRGYTILENRLRTGRCPFCGTEIYGKWSL
ncbi:MAG: AmmeMemoRadiSam system radical SAM enzyme [Verrucomicrobia bacterium]|nr:MAG: AmmeMemoRadiSam system radical SAM enzyme [Verrucomicrobiota bacterium]